MGVQCQHGFLPCFLAFPAAAEPDRLHIHCAQVIGYDMDYTCVNYNVEAWEGRAYSYGMQACASGLFLYHTRSVR